MEGLVTTPRWIKIVGWLGLILQAVGMLYYFMKFEPSYLGIVAISVGLSCLLLVILIIPQQLKQLLKQRSVQLGLGSGASIIVVLVLVIFLGILTTRYHIRWDLSLGAKHTLAPQSVTVLKKLDSPVKAYIFMREGQQGYNEAKNIFDLYTFTTPLFSYQFIDPDREPALAKHYDIRSYGTVVLTKNKCEEKIKLIEEQGVTNALIRLERTGKKKVHFLIGHGERSLTDLGQEGYSELNKAIEQQNYEVESLILATTESISIDTQVLIIAGPKKPLSEVEQKKIGNYLLKGGSVLIMIDPQSNAGLSQWLANRGIELGDNLIIDPQSRLFGASSTWPLTTDFVDHDITRSLKGIICYFPLARTVELLTNRLEEVSGLTLIRSSPSSWAENSTDFLSINQSRLNKEKRGQRGPLSLAVLTTFSVLKNNDKEKNKDLEKQCLHGRLLVIGNSTFAANAHLNQVGNRDLILNAISFLAEEQDLIAIRPKSIANQPLLINTNQAQLIFWGSMVAIPFIFFILGIVIFFSRRKKKI